jgi:hypothetical protein
MKKLFLLKLFVAVSLILLVLISSCKRTEIPVTPDSIPTTNAGGVVDDLAQVTASVSGIVLDESNAPIANAVVTSGVGTTTTNSNGMFILNNISLSKENGNVTVVKAGYFKGIRSFKTTAGKNHSVRLQLMARTLSGTVNATNGGTINANGGATITFPAAAFVTSAGAAYTGTVSVYSRWIDPTAANLPFVIPGDLRGVGTNGVENILETYGMVGADLADGAGNALKIATGKKATISFPIPASLTATAPASIVLWHFDEATTRWKENGTATKAGSTYTAQVDKFSFWNVDVGTTNFINLDYTLINATTNSPLVSTSTRIKRVSNGTYGYGITNNAGFVSGLVPKNEALVLEVVAISGCNAIVYSQNIGPSATDISLGNINLTIPVSQYINFTGTLLNCAGAPVTNGYVSLYVTGGGGAYASTSVTGTFSFSILNCLGLNITYNYQGTDNTTNQTSAILNGSALNGIINLGNIISCGTAISDVYVAGWEAGKAKFWKNGIATELTDGTVAANAYSIFVSQSNDIYVAGIAYGGGKVWKNGQPYNNLFTPSTSNIANSVFFNATDLYVAGALKAGASSIFTPKIWKNNVLLFPMTTSNQNDSYANSVFVSGNDVYVAGYENNTAVFWKNGVETYLTNINPANFASFAFSIFVSGTDVYVAGIEANGVNNVAKVWKNGIASNLSDGTYSAYAKSVFVSNGDVYVAGYEKNQSGFYVAKFWKNGIATSLTNGTNAYATGIFVKGIDVYVCGKEINSSGMPVAKFWKNGLPTNLTFGAHVDEQVNSIFVK